MILVTLPFVFSFRGGWDESGATGRQKVLEWLMCLHAEVSRSPSVRRQVQTTAEMPSFISGI